MDQPSKKLRRALPLSVMELIMAFEAKMLLSIILDLLVKNQVNEFTQNQLLNFACQEIDQLTFLISHSGEEVIPKFYYLYLNELVEYEYLSKNTDKFVVTSKLLYLLQEVLQTDKK